MKKIAYVIPTLSLGGAEKQQVNILNGIDTKKFEVKLFILKNKTQLISQIKNSAIQIEVFDLKSLNSFSELNKFITSIKKFKPEIIHSHMYNANILMRIVKLFFLRKSKLVNHYHGMSNWITKPKLLLEKITAFLVDRFIVVSHESYKLRLEREQCSKEKLQVLYNSVNIQPNVGDGQSIKDDNKIIIGMASRLIPIKNIEGGMNLIAALVVNGLDAELLIAGDGPELDQLENYARKIGIMDKVHFKGFIDDMTGFFHSIDVFCMSSKMEDMPLSLAEAMMMGKPIIASNVGGIPEMLGSMECTKLVNNFENEGELREIVQFIKSLNTTSCYKSLHSYAIEKYDNNQYSKKLEKLYNEL